MHKSRRSVPATRPPDGLTMRGAHARRRRLRLSALRARPRPDAGFPSRARCRTPAPSPRVERAASLGQGATTTDVGPVDPERTGYTPASIELGALILRPETMLGWHRALIRRKWAAYSRRRCGPGRPRMSEECRQLTLRLGEEESPVGATSASKVSGSSSPCNLGDRSQKPAPTAPGPTSPHRSKLSLCRFLRAQTSAIVAADYFTVDIWNLKRLYVVFFVELVGAGS